MAEVRALALGTGLCILVIAKQLDPSSTGHASVKIAEADVIN